MADSRIAQPVDSGGLISLRTPARPWLDRLSPGLSALPTGRLLCCDAPLLGPALWLRLGPSEWWCWWEGESSQSAARLQAVAEASQSEHAACLDLRDGHCVWRLPARAADLLSLGCDLDFERLPGDFAGRTRLAAFPVVLARSPQSSTYMLWVEASLGESLQGWLDRAGTFLRPPDR